MKKIGRPKPRAIALTRPALSPVMKVVIAYLMALALLLFAFNATAQEKDFEEPDPISPEFPAKAETGHNDVENWVTSSFEDFGLNESVQTYNTQPTYTLWFFTRGDEVLSAARVRITFEKDAEYWQGIMGVEILVNEEKLASLSTAEVLKNPDRTLDIDSRILGTNNSMTFKLLQAQTGPCANLLERGTWKLIKNGYLETSGSPLPMQSDLSVLPLPFFDPQYDRNASIPVVFVDPPDSNTLYAAGMAAAWFGLQAGSKVRFPTSVGKLPDKGAIVIAVGDKSESLFALPPPTGPTIRVVDHPGYPGSNRKFFVIQGRTAKDIRIAAANLVLDEKPLYGPERVYSAFPKTPAMQPYESPRWLPNQPTVYFEDITGGDKLSHKGLTGGTMGISFRLAPDIFTWPKDMVKMTIDYTHTAPSTAFVPKVTVELNGAYVGSLPEAEIENGVAYKTTVLELHRSQLKGYNRLQFHVSWPQLDRVCSDEQQDDGQVVETTIAPTSRLHLEEVPHFMSFPNVATFVDDGFPYTRYADLSESVIALVDKPAPESIATFLSLMAHFAAVTGHPGTGAEVIPLSQLQSIPNVDRDILIVGAAPALPLLQDWKSNLPAEYILGRFNVHPPNFLRQGQAILGGHYTHGEALEVGKILSRTPALSVVLGTQSPLQPDRSVVIVTGTTAKNMPSVADLMGYTQAREDGGDLILATDNSRWRFRIGPRYNVGNLSWFTQARWVSANHWLILLPSLFFAALIFARISRKELERKHWERLHGELK